jgi:glucose-1-phosphate thymidylyltransferase
VKGIILAGGLGTRLHPLTRVTNKHLLPVWNKPMVYYPIECLVAAGIEDIMLVTGGNNAGDFLRLLGNGRDFGLKHLNYTYQQGEGGIADALRLCEHFADGEPICVVLGDNIIEKNVRRPVQRFVEQGKGAKIILKEVPDPERFGVAEIEGERVVRIVEKPAQPRSRYAVIGIYLYDAQVFEIIRTLKPSARGELEITDLNRAYLERGELRARRLGRGIAWLDTGTHASLLEASSFIAAIENRQGLKVACLEEVAFRSGFIDATQLERLAAAMPRSPYREYLELLLTE